MDFNICRLKGCFVQITKYCQNQSLAYLLKLEILQTSTSKKEERIVILKVRGYSVLFNRRTITAIFLGKKIQVLRLYLMVVCLTKI